MVGLDPKQITGTATLSNGHIALSILLVLATDDLCNSTDVTSNHWWRWKAAVDAFSAVVDATVVSRTYLDLEAVNDIRVVQRRNTVDCTEPNRRTHYVCTGKWTTVRILTTPNSRNYVRRHTTIKGPCREEAMSTHTGTTDSAKPVTGKQVQTLWHYITEVARQVHHLED